MVGRARLVLSWEEGDAPEKTKLDIQIERQAWHDLLKGIMTQARELHAAARAGSEVA